MKQHLLTPCMVIAALLFLFASGCRRPYQHDDFDAAFDRATDYAKAGDHPKAVAELEGSLSIVIVDYCARYLLAWIYATSPDASCRDGEKALLLVTDAMTQAKKTRSETASVLWMNFCCLAAAKAEIGKFDEAREILDRAIASLEGEKDPAHADKVKKRLLCCQKLFLLRVPLRTPKIALSLISDEWVKEVDAAETADDLPVVAE